VEAPPVLLRGGGWLVVSQKAGRKERNIDRESEQSRGGVGWLGWFPAERAGGGRRRWSAWVGVGVGHGGACWASAGDWLPVVAG